MDIPHLYFSKKPLLSLMRSAYQLEHLIGKQGDDTKHQMKPDLGAGRKRNPQPRQGPVRRPRPNGAIPGGQHDLRPQGGRHGQKARHPPFHPGGSGAPGGPKDGSQSI